MKVLSIMVMGSPKDHKTTPLGEFDHEIIMEVLRNDNESLLVSTIDLTRCNLLVGLENWMSDPVCTDLKKIADLLGIKTIHHSTWKIHVREHFDRKDQQS